jgi:hypothetical protein
LIDRSAYADWRFESQLLVEFRDALFARGIAPLGLLSSTGVFDGFLEALIRRSRERGNGA